MSFTGNVSEIPLSDLIQVNAHNRRTGVIALKGADGVGTLYFREGTLFHARYGSLTGDQAVHALLSARDLAFQVKKLGEESLAAPVVKRIHFSHGAALDPTAATELGGIAQQIERERLRVMLVGHADAEGDAAANETLAEHRALNVAAFLREAGIDSSRIEIGSSGENAPVASNQTANGRAENRRVDLFLIEM